MQCTGCKVQPFYNVNYLQYFVFLCSARNACELFHCSTRSQKEILWRDLSFLSFKIPCFIIFGSYMTHNRTSADISSFLKAVSVLYCVATFYTSVEDG